MMRKGFREELKRPQRANLDPLISFGNSLGSKQVDWTELEKVLWKINIGTEKNKKSSPGTHVLHFSVITSHWNPEKVAQIKLFLLKFSELQVKSLGTVF